MLQDYRRLSLIIIYVPTPITNLSMINYIHYLRYLEPHKTSNKNSYNGWLVGGFNPSEKSWSSSVGMMTFPISGKS